MTDVKAIKTWLLENLQNNDINTYKAKWVRVENMHEGFEADGALVGYAVTVFFELTHRPDNPVIVPYFLGGGAWPNHQGAMLDEIMSAVKRHDALIGRQKVAKALMSFLKNTFSEEDEE